MLRKLLSPRIWRRIYIERAGEPLIYNLVSAFVAAFGNVVKKIEYDILPRQPYAFGLQKAFEFTFKNKQLNVKRLVFIEFGVASGAGLLNICKLAERLSSHYDLPYRVIGFDTGDGMPEPVDYRDHPEKYLGGDFKPHDTDALQRALPNNAEIIYGAIAETVEKLHLEPGDVIGFVSIDVDYWSSTKDCFKLFTRQPLEFLPLTPVYLDDVNNIEHHRYAGELLATAEFNQTNDKLKLSPMNQIRNWRIFKNALWLEQMYWLLKLDSPYFTREFHSNRARVQLSNPYLRMEEAGSEFIR